MTLSAAGPKEADRRVSAVGFLLSVAEPVVTQTSVMRIPAWAL